jgi:pimeloyl-ACP methyl ester carboxylesterase
MRDSEITLSGGRVLAYSEIGEPGWPPVMFFHGAPMSRLHLAYLERQFVAEQLRVVSPDRPGYGRSSPQPGRSMTDWPADVAALADALGVERFLVAGHSSGGPYAVACAALLPDRVLSAIVLGGVTDMAWSDAWGYSAMEGHIMRLADEEAAVAWCAQQFGADGSAFSSSSDFAFPEVDGALFAGEEAGPVLAATVSEAFRQGVVGYAHDIVVQGRPWPFDPAGITVPVVVVHGELDTLIPAAHSRHTASRIPGSVLRVLPGHGHMTTVSELPQMASGLARSSP